MAVGQNIENELQNDSIGIGTVGVGPRADPNFGPARRPAPTMPNDKGKFIRSVSTLGKQLKIRMNVQAPSSRAFLH